MNRQQRRLAQKAIKAVWREEGYKGTKAELEAWKPTNWAKGLANETCAPLRAKRDLLKQNRAVFGRTAF